VIVRLPYGRGELDADLPDHTVVVESIYTPGILDEAEALLFALNNPIGSPSLSELVPAGARVGISVCDITRPFPARRVLPLLISCLPSAEITIFVATGTHRACTDVELEEMLGRDIQKACRVLQHDAFDYGQHAEVGRLSDTGTPAMLQSDFIEQDVRITTGFIEPHFFAGFSGGPKMVAPGLGSIETVLDLHSATRIGHPQAKWGVIEGNPVHDAIREVAKMADITFNLDVTLNRNREITGVFAGELFASHAAGCAFARSTAMIAVDRMYDVVVTSNNGYPLDQNLYQSIKGISAAAQIVRQGGAIVIAAECSDGMPNHGQYRALLNDARGPIEFLTRVAQPDFASHDQWQVQVQAEIQRKARVYVRAEGVREAELRSAWFEPVDDIGRLVRQLGGSVAVIPDGPMTIPYLSKSRS